MPWCHGRTKNEQLAGREGVRILDFCLRHDIAIAIPVPRSSRSLSLSLLCSLTLDRKGNSG